MSCLDNIVTLGLCPDSEKSTSGFRLIDAPGISIKNLALTATETYQSGTDLGMEKKQLALTRIKNDFLKALHSNNVIANISTPIHDSGRFDPNASVGTYGGDRGVIWHAAGKYRGNLRVGQLNDVALLPLTSGDTTLKVIYEQGGVVKEFSWPITVTSGQVNTFGSEELEGFPFVFPAGVSTVKVLVDQTNVAFASSVITCMTGCNGGLPNDCGWVDGWSGTGRIKAEGYGIVLHFSCFCDYTQILCDLSNSYVGELIWLRWQIEIFQEQLLSNRFNEWVVYGATELKETVIPNLQKEYEDRWQTFADGLYNILKTYRDDCLNCRDIRWVVNV